MLTSSGPCTSLPEAAHKVHVQPLKSNLASETAHLTSCSYAAGTRETHEHSALSRHAPAGSEDRSGYNSQQSEPGYQGYGSREGTGPSTLGGVSMSPDVARTHGGGGGYNSDSRQGVQGHQAGSGYGAGSQQGSGVDGQQGSGHHGHHSHGPLRLRLWCWLRD